MTDSPEPSRRQISQTFRRNREKVDAMVVSDAMARRVHKMTRDHWNKQKHSVIKAVGEEAAEIVLGRMRFLREETIGLMLNSISSRRVNPKKILKQYMVIAANEIPYLKVLAETAMRSRGSTKATTFVTFTKYLQQLNLMVREIRMTALAIDNFGKVKKKKGKGDDFLKGFMGAKDQEAPS